MLRRTAFFALFPILLLGCTSVPKDYKFDPNSSNGLVVGSITYESSLGLYSLVIASTTSSELHFASVGYSMWPPMGPVHDEQLGAKGGTFALALPAGEYRIIGWQIKQGYRVSRNTSPVSIPFVVAKGGTSYLGNLHISAHWDENKLRDMSSRDIPVLKARYDALATAPLAFTIQKDVSIEKFGGDYASQMQMPPIVFIPVLR